MEKIGTVIRNHRLKKNLTQEELGNKVFVSKQAVSKWETGRVIPDFEMIRKLSAILDISNDEILGSSIHETKKSRKWIKICVTVSLVLVLLLSISAVNEMIGIFQQRAQFGTAFLTVFKDGELLPADDYTVDSILSNGNFDNCYRLDIDYGEVLGKVVIGQTEVEFGFININCWHQVQIRLDIVTQDDTFIVTQTVSYVTDNGIYEVHTNQAASKGDIISVFHAGLF